MDWGKIKTEYITTSISQRDLAKKYGVSLMQLSRHSTSENWVQEREQYVDKTVTKSIKRAEQKSIDYKSQLYALALKTAKKLDEFVNERSVEELAVLGIKPRDITGAIKDLEDALHVKSDKDLKEQEARIAKLQRDADSADGDKNSTITINIHGGDESWLN